MLQTKYSLVINAREILIILFESELDAFGLLGFSGLADDGLSTAFALGHRLLETHLRLFQRHHATLKDFTIETTDDVLVRLTLIFSSYFNCHITEYYTTDERD